jgi:hypothetical protein
VQIIYEHMGGDAVVEASGMLPHRLGGEREVDVVIRSQMAGHEIIVSVEAAARGRIADVTWVEQLVAKHRYLPTTKLVLVSESGFYNPARKRLKRKKRKSSPAHPRELGRRRPRVRRANGIEIPLA